MRRVGETGSPVLTPGPRGQCVSRGLKTRLHSATRDNAHALCRGSTGPHGHWFAMAFLWFPQLNDGAKVAVHSQAIVSPLYVIHAGSFAETLNCRPRSKVTQLFVHPFLLHLTFWKESLPTSGEEKVRVVK